MGLCGGPIFRDAADGAEREEEPRVVGMLEGMVSRAKDPALEGSGVFVPAAAIAEFVREVEQQYTGPQR